MIKLHLRVKTDFDFCLIVGQLASCFWKTEEEVEWKENIHLGFPFRQKETSFILAHAEIQTV